MVEAFTALYIAGFVLLAILVVCWIVLPVAVIGTKPLLRQILAEQQRTNALLERQVPALRPAGTRVEVRS